MTHAILIVEDNEKNLKLVRDVLRFKGYVTLEARTGREALRIVRERNPQLVLMDIQLPDIDGIAVLGELRADPPTRLLPVVAVSASAMPEDQEKILASGFDAYITKPIALGTLIETVERFLGAAPGHRP